MLSSALDGASKYLNHLLLARGFLQDGKPIDFVRLASDQHNNDKSANFDSNATTASVINLVHDLILRRDRDAEQKEALSSTIRGLRAEESQRILDYQRLQDKNIQLKNEFSTAEAQQRNITAAMGRIQAENKELKEQALKMKSNLDQVRAKAISDIRKRDSELDKLKNHLAGLNRGKKETSTKNTKPSVSIVHRNGRDYKESDASKEWSLANEDNHFLTAILSETTTENVALRKIVEDSLKYLSTLTGLDEHAQQPIPKPDLASIDNAIGIPGQNRDRGLANSTDSAQSDAIIPVQSLGSSMSQVLSHCQSILRDPSFVPIEEVQIRDEEIAKLRAGWEKMADRWKEAVAMMTQWRQKVMSDGQAHSSIEDTNQHDFEIGDFSSIPAFSRSIALRPDGRPVLDPIQEEELTSMLIDHHSPIDNQTMISHEAETTSMTHDETLPEPDETGTPRQNTIHIHVDDEDESDLDLGKRAPQQITASPARRGITISRPSNLNSQGRMPFSNDNANAKKRKSPASSLSPRKRRSVSPVSNSNSSTGRKSTKPASSINSSMTQESMDPLHLDTLTSDSSEDEAEADVTNISNQVEWKAKPPRMTVAQKLAAVEAEATEATEVIRHRQATSYGPTDRRGKDRERSSKPSSGSVSSGKKSTPRDKTVKVWDRDVKSGTQRQERMALKERDITKGKDDRVKKAKDRRRSTLTPAELGSLMGR